MIHGPQLGKNVANSWIDRELPGAVIGCQYLCIGVPGGAICRQSEGAWAVCAVVINKRTRNALESIGFVNYLIADGQKWAIIQYGDCEILALAVVVPICDGCGHVDRQRIVRVGAVRVIHRLQLGEGVPA